MEKYLKFKLKNNKLSLMVILGGLVAIIVAIFLVKSIASFRSNAATSQVRLFFLPAVQSTPPNYTLKLMADSGTYKVGYLKVTLNFDPRFIQLTDEITPVSNLKRVIVKTSKLDANATGTINLVIGINPEDVSIAPTSAFQIANIPIGITTNPFITTNVSISPNVEVVDLTPVSLTATSQDATVNLATPSPMPTIIPSSTPVSSIAPSPIPTGAGVTTIPSIPTGLTGTASNGSVTLRWNANPTSDNVDSYQVYEGDQYLNLNIPANQLTYSTTVSHTGANLVIGSTYSFRVSAHNLAGYGNWTNAISVTVTSVATASPIPTPTIRPTATPSFTPVPTTGSTVTVYAAGTSVGGVYPTLGLYLKDQKVAEYSNVRGDTNVPTYQQFVYFSPTKVNASDVKVYFLNDAYTILEDRNVRIDKIVIDGVSYQSESPSTYSTGSYSTIGGCSAGYKSTEWLSCNGYFAYGQGTTSTGSTPIPTPTQTVTTNVKLQYYADPGSAGSSWESIEPDINIVNNSLYNISLSELKIRYYFTRDTSSQPLLFNCWYTDLAAGCGSVKGNIVYLPAPVSGADSYLEISFTTGTLLGGRETGEILTGIHKKDWSNFYQKNDYSFDSSKSNFQDWSRITLYRNGTLIWGVPPLVGL